jgi:branched-chain amino acid transport system ATP-binding protein
MLLEIEDLTVDYQKARALQGVSLNVDEEEVVCIIGANGAGKTTVLRTISGLKKATSGKIRFQGREIGRMVAHNIVKAGIVHIPAGRMIFAPMTVADNLKIGAFLRRDKRKVALDLDSIYRHFPILKQRRAKLGWQLSGGEQQMLAIGRALMAGPKLLLMDEPSMGLSPLVVAEVGNIIRSINEEGISIVLVEQNSRMALKLANRAYVLEQGKIVLSGDAKDLANDERVKQHYLGGSRAKAEG